MSESLFFAKGLNFKKYFSGKNYPCSSKGKLRTKYKLNDLYILLQIKAKTELLLSAEAAKTAQRADLQNHLDTAQNALQDKQQVGELNAISYHNLMFW